MSRSRKRRKRQGFKSNHPNCSTCYFDETCNLKGAKVCNGYVMKTPDKVITEGEEDKPTELYEDPTNNYGVPLSLTEHVALFVYAVLIFIGAIYLILR